MTDTTSGKVGVAIVHVDWECIPPKASVGSANCVMFAGCVRVHDCGFALMIVGMFM